MSDDALLKFMLKLTIKPLPFVPADLFPSFCLYASAVPWQHDVCLQLL